MWVDIFSASDKEKIEEQIDINPNKPVPYQIRLIIWETRDIPNVDLEDCVDIFVTGQINDGVIRSTDVHYRSQTGFGSFNWRMLYDV